MTTCQQRFLYRVQIGHSSTGLAVYGFFCNYDSCFWSFTFNSHENFIDFFQTCTLLRFHHRTVHGVAVTGGAQALPGHVALHLHHVDGTRDEDEASAGGQARIRKIPTENTRRDGTHRQPRQVRRSAQPIKLLTYRHKFGSLLTGCMISNEACCHLSPICSLF